jgi:integrase
MSVRKRTWTTSKGATKSAWVVDYVDTAGKRRNRNFDRKRDADAFLAQARVEVRGGVHVPDSASITVEAAARLWMESGATSGLERSTLQQRQQHVDLHIAPLIGRRLLNSINGPAVRAFEDALRASGRSPAMCRKIRVSLSGILADAVSRGLAAKNAVRDTPAPRSTASAARHKRRLAVGVDIPTPAEIRAFLGALRGRHRPTLMLATFTGLRISELRALRWLDLDTNSGEIHVRQRADFRNVIGRPKSAAGERVVPVPAAVLAVLEEWRKVCPAGPLGLMFPTARGGIDSNNGIVTFGLKPAWKRAGVTDRYQGAHALRHFFASWCIARVADGGLGLPAQLVQARLGHATLAMTMDVYAHLFPRGDDGGALDAGAARLLDL